MTEIGNLIEGAFMRQEDTVRAWRLARLGGNAEHIVRAVMPLAPGWRMQAVQGRYNPEETVLRVQSDYDDNGRRIVFTLQQGDWLALHGERPMKWPHVLFAAVHLPCEDAPDDPGDDLGNRAPAGDAP